MREKLAACQELALAAAQKAQAKEKLWYDRKSRDRVFEVGQRVLVFYQCKENHLSRNIKVRSRYWIKWDQLIMF